MFSSSSSGAYDCRMRNNPTQNVKGNIFDALGLSASEASALKVKAEILSAILEHIRKEGHTQAQLVSLLDEYQPSVSNLLKGRIAQISIEKLLRYADRLQLETSIEVKQARPTNRAIRARKTMADPNASTESVAALT
jgi:predicted XRE-type DNA-binding protein